MVCTVLIENSVYTSELTAQHGFSVLIENSGRSLLLDAGQNDQFAKNAIILGKNLENVAVAVCSHAHYDHADGFNTFCAINAIAPIYTYWKPGTKYYSTSHCNPGEKARFIGFGLMPEYVNRLSLADRSAPVAVLDGCWIIPVTDHPAALPYKNRTLFTERQGGLQNDIFDHECVLVIETVAPDGRKGLALFNSCSHNGVINSIESVKHFFPGRAILSYTGGFHFPWKRGETVAVEDISAMDALALYALSAGIQLYSGHCTGEAALDYLEQKCGGLLHRLYTGLSYTV